MRTELEKLRIELQSEKEKIAAIEARIKDIENAPEPEKNRYPMKLLYLGEWHYISMPYRTELVGRHYVFAQLVETCKEWNRIDGFEPNWTDKDIEKFCICNVGNKISIEHFLSVKRPICLKDKKTAHLFLDTYRTELEQVKELL